MKRFNLLLISILCATMTVAHAQEENIKKGWNIGPFPAISYNSDLGLQYGAFAEIFDFGDGSTFPEYKQKFSVEGSAYTKGSSVFNFGYDSKYLIPNIRTTFTISYLPDTMMSFYGFNGYMSPYDSTQGDSFYNVDRKLFRTYLDFQGTLYKKLKWALGMGYYNYKIAEVQKEKYAGADNLFNEYLNAGLIAPEDCAGQHLELRAGLVHDTRDSEADPYKGFSTELMLIGSPDLFENEDASFAQVMLSHRGYIPVVDKRLTFAYRLLYQGTLYGDVPFYHQQNIVTLFFRKTHSEGLGGNVSIRGMLRNRAVGAGYFLSNYELRYRFLDFNFIGQSWYLAINPFVDMGRVVQTYKAEEMQQSGNPLIFNGAQESMHMTAGMGGKIVMNRNFVLAAEVGKALNEQDGTTSVILGLNFMF